MTTTYTGADQKLRAYDWAAANRQIVKYAVTFDARGGSPVPEAKQVWPGDSVARPAEPVRAGHAFGGWYSDAGFARPYDFAAPVTADITLYAKWTANRHTVTFMSNGAVHATNAVDYGSAAPVPAEPSWTGHTFGGWYKEAACQNAWNFSSDKVQGDTVLYAKWTINRYAITYISNGAVHATETVDYGSAAPVPAEPSWAGHTFGGWFDDAGLTSPHNFLAPVTGNLTLYAKWTINRYAVTFMSNGAVHATDTVDYGSAVTAPAEPARDGYAFGGWYREPACQNAWNFSTDKVQGGLTLYAKWTPVSYRITYELNGGTDPGNPGSYTIESGEIALKAPAKANCTFAGWTGANGSIPETSVTIPAGATGDRTYTANWKANYTVEFNGNGADGGSTAALPMVAGAAKNLTANGFLRTGYVFAGWATSPEGNVAYSDGQQVVDLTGTAGATVTLYAKWTLVISGTVPLNATFRVESSGEVSEVPCEIVSTSAGALKVVSVACTEEAGAKDVFPVESERLRMAVTLKPGDKASVSVGLGKSLGGDALADFAIEANGKLPLTLGLSLPDGIEIEPTEGTPEETRAFAKLAYTVAPA